MVPERGISVASDRLMVPRLHTLAFVALAAFLVVALMPLAGAALGPVDDHEIPVITQQLAVHGYTDTLALRIDEANGRFRPAYWLGRVSEAALWGENVAGWYLDRALLLVVAFATAFLLARRWLRPLPALLSALLVFAGPQAEAFYRLGPQEAYAVPLTLAGFVLLGRWPGVAMLALAAFTKEPFVLVPLVGAGWLWWRGQRGQAVALGALAGIAGVGILGAMLAAGGDYYTAHGLAIPAHAGRYLYPFIIPLAFAAGWLAQRFRWIAVPVMLVGVVGVLNAHAAATQSAARTRTFAAFVAELRAEDRPLVVTVHDPARAEPAYALGVYLPDLVRPGPDCIEVVIDGEPADACPEWVRLP